jgi:N6-adenosine-specific RNA methylase IME4
MVGATMSIAPNHPALIRLSKAEQALASARDLSDFKKIIDIAEAARTYARAAKLGEDSARHAEEIKLRAQRGAGQFLAKLEKGKGGQPKKNSGQVAPSTFRRAIQEADIELTAAKRYQQVAAVPEPKFTGYLKEARETKKEATTAGLLREAKHEVKAQRKQAAVEQIRNEPQPLPDGPFRVIVADPPWQYASRADDPTHRARNPYPDMTVEAIRALRKDVIPRAADDAVLWLWTTNGFMRDAFTVLDAWGFEHKTILTWVKDQMGTGDWLRGMTEHCLMAIKGHPVVTLSNQTTALTAARGKHSEKPAEFYALVENLCPGARLEMFARMPRDGWQTWGGEAP